MVDPTQFDDMITQAFAVATAIYAVIGMAGYIMFGNAVSEEVCASPLQYVVSNLTVNSSAKISRSTVYTLVLMRSLYGALCWLLCESLFASKL